MKKLFSFLCLLVLGASMNVRATLYEESYSWTNDLQYNEYSELEDGDKHVWYMRFAYNTWMYPSFRIFLCFVGDLQNYGSVEAPPEGTYTVCNDANSVSDINDRSFLGDVGNTYSSRYLEYDHDYINPNTGKEGREIYTVMRSGTITISRGVGGYPYIVVDTYSNIDLSGHHMVITVGEEILDEGIITATSADNAKGNVTGTVVGSDDTFVSGDTYDGGTQITLNANAESGYAFLQWNDGNTDISRTIKVNGDADYEAIFATAYTILTTILGEQYPAAGYMQKEQRQR